MPTFSAPTATPISFGVVKAICEFYGLGPTVRDSDAVQGLRLIFPLDRELAAFVRSGDTSLTDSATSDEQIRFFQRQRAHRSYIKLAEYISRKHGEITLTIENCHELDAPSTEFLRIAAACAGWNVTYIGTEVSSPVASFSSEDLRLLSSLHPDRIEDNVDDICRSAFEFINVGDAWTGVQLGRMLMRVEQSSRIWNLLGLGYAMLQEPEIAEYFYAKWAENGSPLDKIRALYGISMLYARHHSDGLRDIDACATLLSNAYRLIQAFDDDLRKSDAVVFEEVFNRNGFALVLFRRGDVDDALELIEHGIEQLTHTSEKVAIHRSVLLYNLAQCHKQLGRLEMSLTSYERLLEVDPHMPEYHLEMAKCLAQLDRIDEAVSACQKAIELDDTLAVAWSLLGLYLGTQGNHARAASAYQRSYRLDPDRKQTARINAAYNWVFAGDVRSAELLLAEIPSNRLTDDEFERSMTLLAETYLVRGDRAGAGAVLDRALARLPGSIALQANRQALGRS